MPSDDWAKARDEDIGRAELGRLLREVPFPTTPTVLRSEMIKVRAGTPCLIRKRGSTGEYSEDVLNIRFQAKSYLHRTEYAYAFDYHGYDLWVANRFVQRFSTVKNKKSKKRRRAK